MFVTFTLIPSKTLINKYYIICAEMILRWMKKWMGSNRLASIASMRSSCTTACCLIQVILKLYCSIGTPAHSNFKGRYIVGRIATDAPSTHCGRRAADARPKCGRRIAADAQFAAPTMNYYASAACVKARYTSLIVVGFPGISNVSLP